ncbi:non-specific lipid-transfer protein 2-like [Prosopis cineraria]|uniref:non-specific lipid-transfer protein 2-like n=1 Tax=Prosopis cineraria TaxID=364024 RepID=UPI00240F4D65|nr:non-specific lipid-transfer protein 2-like [Prosopis cineraria]
MAMMKKKMGVCLVVMMVMILVVVELPHTVEAVTCSPVALSPCMGAISSSSPPSSECCQKLKEQKPCLCGYLKNPSLRQYVNSPGAKKVASSCGVPIPSC